MRNVTEPAAIDAVARHFSACREADGLAFKGRQVSTVVVRLRQKRAVGPGLTLPRLRFDRVALRVIESLRARLDDIVPSGKVLVVTIAAPIRLAAKTVDSIEKLGRTHLNHPRSRTGVMTELHGNLVRLHLVDNLSVPMSKVAVFIHNPDSDVHLLLGLTESWCLVSMMRSVLLSLRKERRRTGLSCRETNPSTWLPTGTSTISLVQ